MESVSLCHVLSPSAICLFGSKPADVCCLPVSSSQSVPHYRWLRYVWGCRGVETFVTIHIQRRLQVDVAPLSHAPPAMYSTTQHCTVLCCALLCCTVWSCSEFLAGRLLWQIVVTPAPPVFHCQSVVSFELGSRDVGGFFYLQL